jgi:hypothetical protein
MALPVKLAIRTDHLPGDPRTGFVLAFDCGAMSDYVGKGAIDRELKWCSIPGSGQPSRNVQLVKFEDASFLGTTPRQDSFIERPWKNPTTVSAHKVGGGEWSTYGNNAIN